MVMRTPTISSVFYAPGILPTNPAEMQIALHEEFRRIAAAIQALTLGHLDVTTVAPTKPRAGDIRYADGTLWDPGSGEGIYYFNAAGAWAKL